MAEIFPLLLALDSVQCITFADSVRYGSALPHLTFFLACAGLGPVHHLYGLRPLWISPSPFDFFSCLRWTRSSASSLRTPSAMDQPFPI